MSTPLPDPKAPFNRQSPLVLLACCIWGEARGECFNAKLAVGKVVVNRVKARFEKSIMDVILKPWQFSSFNPGDPNRQKLLEPLKYASDVVWDNCLHAADLAMNENIDPSNGALFYHDASIPGPPRAWGDVIQTAQIGRLTFYKPGPAQELKAA